MWLWAALGCAGDDASITDGYTTIVEPPETGDTATVTVPLVGCAPQADNALRADCAWTRSSAGPSAVRVREVAGIWRTFDGPQTPDPTVVIWDLLAETSYEYELVDDGVVAFEGTFETPTLPKDLELDITEIIAGSTSIDRLLVPFTCGGGAQLVAVDAAGRPRWYQGVGSGLITGFDATDRGTVLAVLGRTKVVEYAFDGRQIRSVTQSSDPADERAAVQNTLPRYVHHAVVGRHGRTLVLDTAPVGYDDGLFYLMDGVTEITPTSATAIWDLSAVVDPRGEGEPFGPSYWSAQYPGSIDFAHENSIDLQADGAWIVSFKHLDTVARIDVDGQVDWAIRGGMFASQFDAEALSVGSSVGLDPAFEFPHHPSLSPWGTVLMLDNGRTVSETSRVLEFVVDGVARTADLVRAWDLGVSCPVQGSVFGLADGTVLATCPRSHELFELDDSGIRRSVRFSCPLGESPGSLFRTQPVSL